MAAPKNKPIPRKTVNPDKEDRQRGVRTFKEACRQMKGRGSNPTPEMTRTLPTGEHITLERTQKCPREECFGKGFTGVFVGTGFNNENEPKNAIMIYCPNCGRITRSTEDAIQPTEKIQTS